MALKVIDETTLNVCCTTPLYYLLSFSNFDAINITAREVTLKKLSQCGFTACLPCNKFRQQIVKMSENN